MDLYEKNLALLQEKNPDLATLVASQEDNLPYEVYMDEGEIESLNVVHQQTFEPLYAHKPQETILEQEKTFEVFQEYPYLYFFGIGNGALVKKLLENSRHKRILVIEPDASILYIVLHLVDFREEIKQERLVLLTDQQIHQTLIGPLLDTFERQRYLKLYDLHIMTPFYEAFQERIIAVNRVFLDTICHIVNAVGNDANDSLIGLEHHCMNLPLMIHTPPLSEMVTKVKNTDVAILVSTGPSLAKQLSFLREIAPYVTIVAVDASFPVLYRNGIKPDVVVSMERVPLTGRFFKDTPKEAFEGVVFALSSLQHPEVVQNIKAGTIQMSMRPFGYMMAMELKLWGYLGLGMSAANMAYEVIFHSHFKTCILIGQDLAYGEDGLSHAAGHIFGTDEVKYSENDLWVEAYGGGRKIRTTPVWHMFRNYFEKDINDTKEMMETINATEGGARIYGSIELPFKEAIASRVIQKTPKKPIRLHVLKPSLIRDIQKKATKKISEIEGFLAQQRSDTETLFLEISQLCETLEQQAVPLEELTNVYAKIVEFRKMIHHKLFEQFIWHIAQSLLLVYEMELAKIEVRYITRSDELYQQRVDWIKMNQKWFFGLAGCIDAIQIAMKRKGSHYPHVNENAQ